MSTQGDKLKAIADAIREVDGTDEPIVANDFPERIRSISPGVKSFNGRTGDVVPADGDYTAEQVGALPITGGEITGELDVFRDSNKQSVVSLFSQTGTEGREAGAVKIVGSLDNNVICIRKLSGQGVYFIHPWVGTSYGDPTTNIILRGIKAPTASYDAANKAYVDSMAGGISIASNAGAHNSIFRGKYMGTSVTAAQYAAIAAGTFDDLFIGDYWTINNVNWRIAAFDYYLGTGSTALTTHHAVIVPDTNLDTQNMNDTIETNGGYVGSKMYTANLATARTKVNAAFSGHVLTHQFYLSNAVENGKVSSSINTNQDVVLMSERNVYGQIIMSSECADGKSQPGWDTYDRTQFPLFALAPEFIQKQKSIYWLRDVVASASYTNVATDGRASCQYTTYSFGVRPAFSIHG